MRPGSPPCARTGGSPRSARSATSSPTTSPPPGPRWRSGRCPPLAAGNEHRGLTQQWARAIFEDQPAATKVDGIRYRTAYNDDHALALWDCDNAITVAHDRAGQPLDLPLTHPRIQPRLLAALIPRHITVTNIDETHCPNCQRAAAP
ncbi:RES domain-containing protein [Rhodococcus sp. IEGM 1351]|uniref:RES domain-containing protein n=1 Tax=Rhodococcus sp. IEGM 1351 TaxID=3047089 RepID=UPI0024B683F1|nr:RES domain-containing protein [Rhodococcus sp. IEGM 1351]MDI9940684.1 RES domain-containing protein [Rhodococcus sp. IEGM 1351]